MGGRKFTRMNKYGTKLSKIDRILDTQHFLSMWPNAQLIALPRYLSDHCPIIIKTYHADFSPIPFKFYNSWLLNNELGTIITHSWYAPLNRRTIHPATTLKHKLQLLKSHIREWRTDMLQNEANKIGKILNEIQLLDLKAESSGLLDLEIQERLDLLKHKEECEHIQRLDLLQKAKIK
ncbi:cytochrome P450 [Tanacetum coccineum]|uniref:Cytochrome P450 n=1 Tax=Tanacetum coccineum TaxID=301880 RepID=A0ABQ5CGZ1_9ASTR